MCQAFGALLVPVKHPGEVVGHDRAEEDRMPGRDSILCSLVVCEKLGYLGRAAVWTSGPLTEARSCGVWDSPLLLTAE